MAGPMNTQNSLITRIKENSLNIRKMSPQEIAAAQKVRETPQDVPKTRAVFSLELHHFIMQKKEEKTFSTHAVHPLHVFHPLCSSQQQCMLLIFTNFQESSSPENSYDLNNRFHAAVPSPCPALCLSLVGSTCGLTLWLETNSWGWEGFLLFHLYRQGSHPT